jgi:hypothetical protein
MNWSFIERPPKCVNQQNGVCLPFSLLSPGLRILSLSKTGEQKINEDVDIVVQPEGMESWNKADLECVHPFFAYKCE